MTTERIETNYPAAPRGRWKLFSLLSLALLLAVGVGVARSELRDNQPPAAIDGR